MGRVKLSDLELEKVESQDMELEEDATGANLQKEFWVFANPI
jgi:hypothetical protein